MPFKTIAHMPLNEALALTPRDDTAFLVISDPGHRTHMDPQWGYSMSVEFLGLCYNEKMLQKIGRHQTWRLGPVFTEDLALAVRYFIESAHDDGIAHLVVACHNGLNRSGAVAKWAHLNYGGIWTTPSTTTTGLVYSLLMNPSKFSDYFSPPLLPSLRSMGAGATAMVKEA